MRQKTTLPNLPQPIDEVWQVHARNVVPLVDRHGSKNEGRQWRVLVVIPPHDESVPATVTVVRSQFIPWFPSVKVLWEQIVDTMAAPVSGIPRRPHFMQFRSPLYEKHLRDDLNSIGVRSRVTANFGCWETVFEQVNTTNGFPHKSDIAQSE